ncbi:hypothetical protein D3C81_1660940 [compost metagenome]
MLFLAKVAVNTTAASADPIAGRVTTPLLVINEASEVLQVIVTPVAGSVTGRVMSWETDAWLSFS